MPLSTVFQSHHGNSSHNSCLSWVSAVLGWGSEDPCPRTLPQKIQRIQWGWNPGLLDYESNSLPLTHTGTLFQCNHVKVNSGLYRPVSVFEPYSAEVELLWTITQIDFNWFNPFPNDNFSLFQTERFCKRQFQN